PSPVRLPTEEGSSLRPETPRLGGRVPGENEKPRTRGRGPPRQRRPCGRPAADGGAEEPPPVASDGRRSGVRCGLGPVGRKRFAPAPRGSLLSHSSLIP